MNQYSISDRLRALSFVGILLVVMVHMFRIPSNWMNESGCCGLTHPQILINFGVITCLGRLAVPMFFVISGYWLVKNYSPTFEWWKESIRKRIASLVIPMIVWSMIAFIYEMVCGRLCMPSSYNWYLPPEAQQFWYFRSLFILIVASPLFCLVLKRLKLGLTCICILWLFAFCGIPGQSQYFMWIDICAFAVGIWLGFHQHLISNYLQLHMNTWWCRRGGGGVYLLFVIFSSLSVVFAYMHMRILYNRAMYLVITTGVLALWEASPLFVRAFDKINWVYSLNVFIFAIHFVILWRIGDILTWIGMEKQTVLFILSQYFLVVGVCIGVGWIVKRYFPRTIAFLSGGRR